MDQETTELAIAAVWQKICVEYGASKVFGRLNLRPVQHCCGAQSVVWVCQLLGPLVCLCNVGSSQSTMACTAWLLSCNSGAAVLAPATRAVGQLPEQGNLQAAVVDAHSGAR
jgi:hypothetical protein